MSTGLCDETRVQCSSGEGVTKILSAKIQGGAIWRPKSQNRVSRVLPVPPHCFADKWLLFCSCSSERGRSEQQRPRAGQRGEAGEPGAGAARAAGPGQRARRADRLRPAAHRCVRLVPDVRGFPGEFRNLAGRSLLESM